MIARLAWPVVALPLLAHAPAELEYGPEQDSELSRSFLSHVEGEFEVSVRVDGEVQETDIPSGTLVSDETIRVRDVIGSVSGGRPTRLRRTYEEIETLERVTLGDREFELTESSPFVGETLSFVWDEETAEYSIELSEETELTEDLVEELTEDLDLRGLLPSSSVEPGDTWSGDVNLAGILMFPGGQLHAHDPENYDDTPPEKQELDRQVLANLDGSIEVELVSIEDGIAELAVTVDVTTNGEAEVEPKDSSYVTESSYAVDIARSGKGRASWSLTKGHLLDFGNDVGRDPRIRRAQPLQQTRGELRGRSDP